MKTNYTLQELEAMPTLTVGQADDLKVETEDVRIWLSRCGVADGEPYEDKVTVERYDYQSGRWFNHHTYQAQ